MYDLQDLPADEFDDHENQAADRSGMLSGDVVGLVPLMSMSHRALAVAVLTVGGLTAYVVAGPLGGDNRVRYGTFEITMVSQDGGSLCYREPGSEQEHDCAMLGLPQAQVSSVTGMGPGTVARLGIAHLSTPVGVGFDQIVLLELAEVPE